MATKPRNPVVFPSTRVQDAARRAALADSHTLERLYLDPVAKGIPGVDVKSRITSARVLLTMDGASTLTVSLHDPDWDIEASGLLTPVNGRLRSIDVMLDTLAFRLVKSSRQDPETLALTFEDRAVALLRQHNRPLTAARARVTRAQFIERLVREVKSVYIPFYSPEKSRRQQTQRPDYPAAAPTQGDSGFDRGTRFKIKDVTADQAQMRNVATVLTICDQENAPKLARLAILVAGIQENTFRVGGKPSSADARGVFQLLPETERALGFTYKDTAAGARTFLRRGFYRYGGAIKLANDHPNMSPGEIASRVEGSATDGQNAGDYNQWLAEAKRILSLWNSGTTGSAPDAVRLKRGQYTRGQPGQRETSWAAATRLAEEVQWRVYAVGGVVAFVSDDYLITVPAGLTLDTPTSPVLLARPSYDLDNGKLAGTIDMTVHAQRWAVWPGEVVVMDGKRWGPIEGRWLLLEADQNLVDPTDCQITLTKPLPPLKEPAPEAVTLSVGTRPEDLPSGVAATLAWARSKIGHYKEEWGSNRGAELNKLENQFGFSGAPWCAMFATTAVAHGAGDQVKTASVPQIRTWAAEGSHGYLKGFRGTPKPGDLVCIGGDHVLLVEKVKGRTVKCIQGNGSAGQVDRRDLALGYGDYARPNYRS